MCDLIRACSSGVNFTGVIICNADLPPLIRSETRQPSHWPRVTSSNRPGVEQMETPQANNNERWCEMKKNSYKRNIKGTMKQLDLYNPMYDLTIETLAEILETRDTIREQYEAEGSQPVMVRVSDRGAENPSKNPLLQLLNEQQRLALSFMKELGMSPSALKKISEELVSPTVNNEETKDMMSGVLQALMFGDQVDDEVIFDDKKKS